MGKLAFRPVLTVKKFPHYAAGISLVYFFFVNLLGEFLGAALAAILYVSVIFLIVVGYFASRRRQLHVKGNAWWILFFIIMILSSRKNIVEGNFLEVTTYLTLTVLLIILCSDMGWTESLWEKAIVLGCIHVIATILLWLCTPWLYNLTMYQVWGLVPVPCTLADAYKAGLSKHYSTNGIYCGMAFLLLGSELIGYRNRKLSQKKILQLVLSAFAVLLTTKRAHLLFSVFALVIVYFICNPKKSVNKGMRVLLVASIAIVAFFALAPVIPVFGNFISRFTEAEDISSNRFEFWELAYDLFLENKTWGIGWGQFVQENPHGTSVHNIYIQLLCETGIIGFTAFLLAMLSTYIVAIRDYRKHVEQMTEVQRKVSTYAIAVQTFVIIYGLTGNCLYDVTVYIYYIACAASMAVHYAVPTRKNDYSVGQLRI